MIHSSGFNASVAPTDMASTNTTEYLEFFPDVRVSAFFLQSSGNKVA
jgi:hypothetical protein